MREPLVRRYDLPFGYRVIFSEPKVVAAEVGMWEVEWEPHFPKIETRRAQRRFLEAYKIVRNQFVEELSVLLGGSIVVVDTTDLETADAITVIEPGTKH